jgi:hypothetical protein
VRVGELGRHVEAEVGVPLDLLVTELDGKLACGNKEGQENQ